ncbi:MAG: adenine phosphoribosyltransferase [Candidatus Omnitrophica bacterium]|nr:adenine phosphoribosyltransferase [Candidatus Omnitrophota bacterium]
MKKTGPVRDLSLNVVKSLIRAIPDFPKKGILFRDITLLLQDREGFQRAIKLLQKECPKDTESIAAVESRGFILGGALAANLKVGFVPIRKKGKLPYRTAKITYQLEYGTETIEIHTDSICPGGRVVLVDDLLATGGTATASAKLIENLGGKIIKILFLIELTGLKGREKLKKYNLFSLIKY